MSAPDIQWLMPSDDVTLDVIVSTGKAADRSFLDHFETYLRAYGDADSALDALAKTHPEAATALAAVVTKEPTS